MYTQQRPHFIRDDIPQVICPSHTVFNSGTKSELSLAPCLNSVFHQFLSAFFMLLSTCKMIFVKHYRVNGKRSCSQLKVTSFEHARPTLASSSFHGINIGAYWKFISSMPAEKLCCTHSFSIYQHLAYRRGSNTDVQVIDKGRHIMFKLSTEVDRRTSKS